MRDYITMTLVLLAALWAECIPLAAALIGAAGVVTLWPTRSKKKTHLPLVHKKGRQSAGTPRRPERNGKPSKINHSTPILRG